MSLIKKYKENHSGKRYYLLKKLKNILNTNTKK